MKISDYISKTIQEYPSLYKDENYEKSKLKVLDHIFFTIGNGVEIAETINPEDGGYMTKPIYDSEYERIPDKLYGSETYKPLPDDYFETVIYSILASENPLEITKRTTNYGDKIYFRYKKFKHKHQEPILFIEENKDILEPYPICFGFSIVDKIFSENIFIQDDWMKELIVLCERTLEYFNIKTQYINNIYYPKISSIEKDLNHFKEYFEHGGMKKVKELRETWNYEIKDTVPDYTEIKTNKTELWNKFRESQIDFLTKFLLKYRK